MHRNPSAKPTFAMRLFVLLAFFAISSPTLAAATEPFCGGQGVAAWGRVKEKLVGEWAITHLSGYAETAGMVLPIPADFAPETFTMSLIDGILTGYHPQALSPLEIKPAEEPRWIADVGRGQPAPTVTPDDAAITIAGCDQMELPRVIGRSGGMVAGHQLDFTFRMIVFDESHMWGVIQVTTTMGGESVTAHRTVMIEKLS